MPSDQDHLAVCLDLALGGATREYPHVAGPTLREAGDLLAPRERHPAFFGCFDWHSAVHGHWTLARLVRIAPALPGAKRAAEVLSDHLTAGHLRTEAACFEHDPAFERPYGWAWALRLEAELHAWPALAAHAGAMEPLVQVIADLALGYLPRLQWPIRAGTHASTAYALGLMLDWARLTRRPVVRAALLDHAERLFGDDRDWPLEYEPSGEDFLSPGLVEADLMRRVRADDFEPWLAAFLPGLEGRLPRPIEQVDARDGRLGHLAGLNLSRCAAMRGIAAALPRANDTAAALRGAACDHLACGLEQVQTGSYAAEHWLGTFAVYSMTEVNP